jgi:transcriptional regulator with XRE-family HTH domain
MKLHDRKELGEFLRSRRARLAPGDVGLPPGQRRRAAGLRREEVAQLCGLSVTWYTWIEQGRDISISAAALDRIATALRLGGEERSYLHSIANSPRTFQDNAEPENLPQGFQQWLDHQRELPAYALGRFWDVLGWNRAAAGLFGDFGTWPRNERNLLRYTFCNPAARKLIVDWDVRARRLVAEFRADCGPYLEDAFLIRFVARLEADSPEFMRLWRMRDVVTRAGGIRSFRHPTLGPIEVEQMTFRPTNRPDIKLVVHLPSGSPGTTKQRRACGAGARRQRK